MSHQHVVNLSYRIKYETKDPVPIDEVVRALESLNSLLASASSVISGISDIQIQGQQIFVERIESGSLIEDIGIKLIFGSKEKMDEFLLWLHDTNMRGIVIGALLGGALTYGYGVLTHNNADASANTGSLITNSPNSMIINFPAGELSDEMRILVKQEFAKRVRNKDEIAKQTINFFKPMQHDPSASISLGEGEVKAAIPAATIAKIPTKYVAKKNNRFEEISGVEIELRATDLDNKKTGWAGSITGVTNRLKIEIDPTIDPSELYGRSKITADVTLERVFDPSFNEMMPKRIVIRTIHEPESIE